MANTENAISRRGYRGLIFDIDYFEDKTPAELEELKQYMLEHGVRAGIVTLEKKPEYSKWLRKATIPITKVVGGGDIKVGRFAFSRKPEAKPMKVCAAWLDCDFEEVLSICTKDVDLEASKAAGIDHMVNPDPKDIIPLLCEQPHQTATVDLNKHYPLNGIFGAVCGDIIGSTYESDKRRTYDYDFELFTKHSKASDDSILTMAIAKWLMGDRSDEDLTRQLVRFAYRHPTAYWGSGFRTWFESSDHAPRVAESNGSAMRVGPVGYVAASIEECMALAKQSAQMTHNSEAGIRGAQAIACSVFMMRQGKTKQEVKTFVEATFGYNLDQTLNQIRETYPLKKKFSLHCDKCAAEAITCWLLANSFEEVIRNAVSLGGDADTLAAMAGAIAGATPGMEIPEEIGSKCYQLLPDDLKTAMLQFMDYLR